MTLRIWGPALVLALTLLVIAVGCGSGGSY